MIKLPITPINLLTNATNGSMEISSAMTNQFTNTKTNNLEFTVLYNNLFKLV
jgi:hypothetical protein